MIRQLQLKFGQLPGQEPLKLDTTPVTVFVGPNHSGKSKVLTELHQYCCSGQQNTTDLILDRLEFEPLEPEKVNEKIRHVQLEPNHNEALQPGHILVGKKGSRMQVNQTELASAIANANTRAHHFCSWFLSYNTLILDGKNRISLVQQQPCRDLQQPAHTSFQLLFRDDVKRAEVRRIIHDAFGSYLVIDPTNMGQLRLRLSDRAPASPIEERGWHDEAVSFHSKALLIDQASDGVKAFTGMITEIIAGDPSVLLIDEPEAFLHPSLAFKLGKEIATSSMGSEKRLFVSTHSPNFVMGCIQSGAPINIVRLTYRNGVATARLLPSADILKFMRNPLLRSTNVLNALFYEHVVVTESDADRAFYQEINERMLTSDQGIGIPNCLFMNAQNKQTVQTIIGPLRKIGIPAAGIVDIDILKEGGTVWSSFLDGGGFPEIDKHAMANTRSEVKKLFDGIGRNMKQDGGIDLLVGPERESASNLFDQLDRYGLFVVRRGELESWLQSLGATGHGPQWLISIFEKMGDTPDTPGYLKAGTDDVWAFLAQVGKWLQDPMRKGIPT